MIVTGAQASIDLVRAASHHPSPSCSTALQKHYEANLNSLAEQTNVSIAERESRVDSLRAVLTRKNEELVAIEQKLAQIQATSKQRIETAAGRILQKDDTDTAALKGAFHGHVGHLHLVLGTVVTTATQEHAQTVHCLGELRTNLIQTNRELNEQLLSQVNHAGRIEKEIIALDARIEGKDRAVREKAGAIRSLEQRKEELLHGLEEEEGNDKAITEQLRDLLQHLKAEKLAKNQLEHELTPEMNQLKSLQDRLAEIEGKTAELQRQIDVNEAELKQVKRDHGRHMRKDATRNDERFLRQAQAQHKDAATTTTTTTTTTTARARR